MRLTYRLAALVALGALPLLLAGSLPWLLPAVLLYDFLLAACALADLLATPDPNRF